MIIKFIIIFCLFLNLSFSVDDQFKKVLNIQDASSLNATIKEMKKIQNFKLNNPFFTQLFLLWKDKKIIDQDLLQMVEKKLLGEKMNLAEVVSFSQNKKTTLISTDQDILSALLSYDYFNNKLYLKSIEEFANVNSSFRDLIYSLDQSIKHEKIPNSIFIGDLSQIRNSNDLLNNDLYQRPYSELDIFVYKLIKFGDFNINKLASYNEQFIARLEFLKHSHFTNYFFMFSSLNFLTKHNRFKDSVLVIKKYLEPKILEEKELKYIEYYFLTMGRLFYNKGLYQESKYFYSLIPQNSSYFLTAKSEEIWSIFKTQDYSLLNGFLQTYNLDIININDKPYLPLAMGASYLNFCNYQMVNNSINNYIKLNENLTNKIGKTSVKISRDTLKNQSILENIKAIKKENIRLKKIISDQKLISSIDKIYSASILKQEYIMENTNKIIKDTLLSMKDNSFQKMRLIKIELLSKLRANKKHLAFKNKKMDIIKTSSSSIQREKDQIIMPMDQVIWGDEAFSIVSTKFNFCI